MKMRWDDDTLPLFFAEVDALPEVRSAQCIMFHDGAAAAAAGGTLSSICGCAAALRAILAVLKKNLAAQPTA